MISSAHSGFPFAREIIAIVDEENIVLCWHLNRLLTLREEKMLLPEFYSKFTVHFSLIIVISPTKCTFILKKHNKVSLKRLIKTF
jgi:hypothetical protein